MGVITSLLINSPKARFLIVHFETTHPFLRMRVRLEVTTDALVSFPGYYSLSIPSANARTV